MAEAKQVNRDDLYQRVCEEPLSKVAPKLGISPTALAALCRAHQIPYPGSGYWTRKSLGLDADLPALPAIDDDPSLDIVVIPSPVKRRAISTRPSIHASSRPATPEAAATAANIAIPEKLTRPHWLVAEWIEDREKRRREALRSREEWRIRNAPPPWSELDMRRHRLLDAIFKAVEKRGGSISKGDKLLARATIDGEKIDFQIREKTKQVKVAPENKRSSYMTTDLVGTGKLVLAIKTYLRGPHNEEWRETDSKPLELFLGAFVDRLFEGAQILKAWHIEQEEDRKRWAEEAAQRAATKQQKADDNARRARLIELADQWRAAQQLEEMLTVLVSQSYDPAAVVGNRSIAEWMQWARSTLAELQEPVVTLHGLFRSISETSADDR